MRTRYVRTGMQCVDLCDNPGFGLTLSFVDIFPKDRF